MSSVHGIGDKADPGLSHPSCLLPAVSAAAVTDQLPCCPAETRGWIQPTKARDPHRRSPPAAACGQEHGLPEIQPSRPVPLHQIHTLGHTIHPAQCTGVLPALAIVPCLCPALALLLPLPCPCPALALSLPRCLVLALLASLVVLVPCFFLPCPAVPCPVLRCPCPGHNVLIWLSYCSS